MNYQSAGKSADEKGSQALHVGGGMPRTEWGYPAPVPWASLGRLWGRPRVRGVALSKAIQCGLSPAQSDGTLTLPLSAPSDAHAPVATFRCGAGSLAPFAAGVAAAFGSAAAPYLD